MAWTTIDVERALTQFGALLRSMPTPTLSAVASAGTTALIRDTFDEALRDARRELQEALAAAQREADTLAVLTKFRMGAALDPRLDEDQLLVECMTLLHLGGAGVISQAHARVAAVAMLEGWQQRQQLAATGRLTARAPHTPLAGVAA
jgi:hypothetical protein